MLEMPAAFEEVDGTTKLPQGLLTTADQVGLEINRIIRVAHEEHEKFLYERGIAELARREAIIARTFPPYSNNISTLQAEYEEEVKYLKQLLPEEDLDWLDEFSF
ncbi:hypothetical protein ACLKA6_013244 [Drosophila palustris]